MIRFVVIVAALILSSAPASALPSCSVMKLAYAPFSQYGIAAAEKWLKDHGYSKADIREARKCLTSK